MVASSKKELTPLPRFWATCLAIIMAVAYMANRLDYEPSPSVVSGLNDV